jgi:hypothetical protein
MTKMVSLTSGGAPGGIRPPTHGLEGMGGVEEWRGAIATYAAPLLASRRLMRRPSGGRVRAELWPSGDGVSDS